MLKAAKLQATIDGKRRLIVDVPDGFAEGPVELILLGEEAATKPATPMSDLHAFMQSLPAGTRTKEEIDAYIDAERASWD